VLLAFVGQCGHNAQMDQRDDYDDEPSQRRWIPMWLMLVILIAEVLLIPTLLLVLFLVAFGFSNM
jgi:hypothetical protein